jgi:hypothetical protein
MGIYLMGYISSLPIHFQNLTSNRLPEYDSAEEECPQLVDFPSIFSSPLYTNQFLTVTNRYIKRKYFEYDVCIFTAI